MWGGGDELAFLVVSMTGGGSTCCSAQVWCVGVC